MRKGLSPFGVRTWAWSDEDSLELGDVRKDSGSEAHNGHALLREAGFQPRIVTYMPFLQAYVGAADGS